MADLRYIQVAVPVKLAWNPWYRVPDGLAESLHVGSRVRVHMGRKEYVGVVLAVAACITDSGGLDISRIKPIDGPAEGLPDISSEELRFWRFIADYYLCSVGEVFKAAYPQQKIQSETVQARAVTRAADKLEMQIAKTSARLDKARAMLAKAEETVASARPGTKRLAAAEASAEAAGQKIASETRTLEWLESQRKSECCVPSPSLHRNTAAKPLLLVGNSSARASEYKKMVRKTLEDGFQALVLVSETDFSDNLAAPLREISPDLQIFDSRSSQVARRKLSDRVRKGDPLVVLGTRSSIFLPFSNLGLIIVDEEQDPGHKVQEPAPRINVRDSAVMLSSIHGATCILGSASPSFESIHNAATGKYIRTDLPDTPAPVEVISIPAEKSKHGFDGMLTFKLIQAIRWTEGLITLVRGWENEADLAAQAERLFPGREIQILTAPAARKSLCHSALTAIIQADCFSGGEDFRSDEKALQTLSAIRSHCSRMIIQTAKPDHPIYKALASGDVSDMLAERKAFDLPPYSRIVDIKTGDGKVIKRVTLARTGQSAQAKSRLASSYGPRYTIDVDPL